jgi:hypothetical protein
MKEKAFERKRKLAVESEGGAYLKQTCHAGIPDRLVLMPIPEEHRELVSRYVWFEEVKSSTGKVSPVQQRVIQWLRDMGYKADVKSP